jgi:2-polyprenyl-3-methyl-5-hydroxy-6-metoxy-1,4-benzoquinol methylase
MSQSSDIVKSWEANAEAWIQTVQNKELESRRIVTNRAIIDAVLDSRPQKVLDLGCGEGWLSRTLRRNGVDCCGTDAVEALINEAISKDGNYYWQHTYEDIIAGRHTLPAPFDAIVINFALLDKHVTDQLIATLPTLLTDTGLLFVQTLHPMSMPEEERDQTGWKEACWKGMKRKFTHPYRWYYRTIFDWMSLFRKSGFQKQEIREGTHPDTAIGLSMIYILKVKTESNA